jgi:hypothetical protein
MRAFLVLALLSTTARADVDHEVVLGSHIRALHTSSANALTDDSLAGPVFGYAYRLPLDVVPKLELWGTGTLLFGSGDGEMFQTLSTNIDALQITGGIRARYPLWRRVIVANARLDLGAQRIDVALADAANHTARDSGWGATSTAAVGLELNPFTFRSFGLGFRVEYGYTVNQAIEMTAKSNGAPEDTIELDRMAASLGHLDIGGKYFSFTLMTRF